jgi:hypothetical protein
MSGALNPNRDSRFLGALVDGYADGGRAVDPPYKPFVCHWIVTTFADLGTSMGLVAVIAQQFRTRSAVKFVEDMAELALESAAVTGVEG